jgi:hypothetical protein
MQHRVSNIVFNEQDTYAVYYDEIRDRIHHLLLAYTVVHDIEGASVYRPILEGNGNVDRNWIFLELSEEVRPMSHYSDVILSKLVEKVRLSMRGY